MAKKFITDRELRLINSWSREVMQNISQAEIIYYAISVEKSKVHSFYREAIVKESRVPTRINAVIDFSQISTEAKAGTLDSNYRIMVTLHVQECNERNIRPREGDFISLDGIFFEVSSVGFARPVFSQMQARMEYALTCVASREGTFSADSDKKSGVDNGVPVITRRARSLGFDP